MCFFGAGADVEADDVVDGLHHEAAQFVASPMIGRKRLPPLRKYMSVLTERSRMCVFSRLNRSNSSRIFISKLTFL